VLNNWTNRPNTACKYEIYCSYFVCHMIYRCNFRHSLLVEGLFRYNAYFIIMLCSLRSHHEHYNELSVYQKILCSFIKYSASSNVEEDSKCCCNSGDSPIKKNVQLNVYEWLKSIQQLLAKKFSDRRHSVDKLKTSNSRMAERPCKLGEYKGMAHSEAKF